MKTVDLVYILDRSGSMLNLIDDAIGGFNAFVEEQKKLPGEAYLTLVAFDNKYEIIHDRVPLADVRGLTRDKAYPRGSTALLDAIGTTIAKFQPDWNVAFTVMTDGHENASEKFTVEQIKSLIETGTEGGWQFDFAGAGVDNFDAGLSMGFRPENIVQTTADQAGVAAYSSRFAASVSNYRAS